MLSKKDYLKVIEKTTLTSVDIIFFYKNKILLGYRNNEPAKNYWFTPGSRTYKMEKIDDAIKRVANNECNIDISNLDYKLVGVYDHIYDNNFDNNNFSTHYIVSAYLIKLESLPDLKKDSQHSQFMWASIEEIKNNSKIHLNVKRYIPDLLNKI